MSAAIKPEIDEEKLLSDLADCMELDQFGQWFNKESARKVLKPLLDDSKQNDVWAADARRSEELFQQVNAQLQQTRKERDEARAQLDCMRGALAEKASKET